MSYPHGAWGPGQGYGGGFAPIEPLFFEKLGMPRRAWGLFFLAIVVTVLAIHPVFVPLVAISWGISVWRFARSQVRIDPDTITVGKRSAALAGLDLSTLGRARNPLPWRYFSPRYLGANPIWSSDSIRVRGRDLGGQLVLVDVGTNRRDHLVAVLTDAVPAARARAVQGAGVAGLPVWPVAPVGPPPAWYDDPWAPGFGWRYWDGWRWTAFVAPRYTVWGSGR